MINPNEKEYYFEKIFHTLKTKYFQNIMKNHSNFFGMVLNIIKLSVK